MRDVEKNEDPNDWRVAWFLALEDARRRNDFKRAAEALEQLERLGVRVKYLRKKRGDLR